MDEGAMSNALHPLVFLFGIHRAKVRNSAFPVTGKQVVCDETKAPPAATASEYGNNRPARPRVFVTTTSKKRLIRFLVW